eukprot:scaffold1534_cov122-Isochrysis_galbana.AAC.1
MAPKGVWLQCHYRAVVRAGVDQWLAMALPEKKMPFDGPPSRLDMHPPPLFAAHQPCRSHAAPAVITAPHHSSPPPMRPQPLPLRMKRAEERSGLDPTYTSTFPPAPTLNLVTGPHSTLAAPAEPSHAAATGPARGIGPGARPGQHDRAAVGRAQHDCGAAAARLQARSARSVLLRSAGVGRRRGEKSCKGPETGTTGGFLLLRLGISEGSPHAAEAENTGREPVPYPFPLGRRRGCNWEGAGG